MNTWAVFLQRPSDLGFSDEGYDLPPLDVRYHEVATRLYDGSFERDGQGILIRDEGTDLVAAAREKRDTIELRVAKVAELVAEDPAAHFILWHDLEDERRAIDKAVPGVRSVFGAQDLELREEIVADFSAGRLQHIGAKPIMLGSGTNLQHHCHRAVFAGVTAKFNDFIQAIHRIQRFGQTADVRIDIVHTDQERGTVDILRAKWASHDEKAAVMSEIIRTFGLEQLNMADEMRRAIGVTRREASGDGWRVANNDCVDETKAMPDGSVDLIVTSIPFANHYEYTPSYNDFGHTENNDHFWRQMDFLTPELVRVLAPGRIAALHVKDRILFGNVTGFGRPSVSPFHAEGIFHGLKHGLVYCGMITVVTDVVFENNGTYRLSFSEMLKDSSKMGVGSPEYVLLFFKPQTDRSKGYADKRVAKEREDYSLARWQIDAHAFWRSSGDRMLTAAELARMPTDVLARIFPKETLKGVYDYREHVAVGEALGDRGALPTKFMALAPGSADPDVWHDVVRMRTLNGEQAARGREKHVCLARGSLVLTRRGYLPIETVSVGDEVLTHKGRWRRVLVAARTGYSPVVDLRAQGVAALTLTPDHKLWARKSDWARARDGALRAQPDWLRADETVGGYVNLKLPPEEDCDLSEQECWLIGRWLADGHVGTRGDYIVSVGPAKLAEFLERAGEHAGSQSIRTAVQVRLKSLSRSMAAALSYAGHGAAGKQVPVRLLSLPTAKAKALLQGYLAGDGHLVPERGTWMATSVSRALLLGMGMLAQRVFGAVANLRPGRPAGAAVIEGRTVQTQQEWILSFDHRWDGRRKTPFVLEDGPADLCGPADGPRPRPDDPGCLQRSRRPARPAAHRHPQHRGRGARPRADRRRNVAAGLGRRRADGGHPARQRVQGRLGAAADAVNGSPLVRHLVLDSATCRALAKVTRRPKMRNGSDQFFRFSDCITDGMKQSVGTSSLQQVQVVVVDEVGQRNVRVQDCRSVLFERNVQGESPLEPGIQKTIPRLSIDRKQSLPHGIMQNYAHTIEVCRVLPENVESPAFPRRSIEKIQVPPQISPRGSKTAKDNAYRINRRSNFQSLQRRDFTVPSVFASPCITGIDKLFDQENDRGRSSDGSDCASPFPSAGNSWLIRLTRQPVEVPDCFWSQVSKLKEERNRGQHTDTRDEGSKRPQLCSRLFRQPPPRRRREEARAALAGRLRSCIDPAHQPLVHRDRVGLGAAGKVDFQRCDDRGVAERFGVLGIGADSFEAAHSWNSDAFFEQSFDMERECLTTARQGVGDRVAAARNAGEVGKADAVSTGLAVDQGDDVDHWFTSHRSGLRSPFPARLSVDRPERSDRYFAAAHVEGDEPAVLDEVAVVALALPLGPALGDEPLGNVLRAFDLSLRAHRHPLSIRNIYVKTADVARDDTHILRITSGAPRR
ncbi:Hint domain-containing protein [Aureimonas leprariae]|uniref:Hint domain-containing protein n=1 Tax=Plantimonas leprariae TaxID=2615207 RepID=UPI003CCCAF59